MHDTELQDDGDAVAARLRRLRSTLLIVGAGWTAFFVAAVPITLFDLIDHRSTAGRLLLWGHGGNDYLLMISAINIVIGVALLLAARDPSANRQVIGLCLTINTAHMATMFALGVAGDGTQLHLVGDIAFGILPTVALALAFLPTLRELH